MEKWAIAALLTCLLVGCRADEKAAPDSSPDVGAVIKGVDNPFFLALRDGMEDAAARNDVQLRVREAADLQDTAGQALAVEDLAGADCYVVNPINRTNLIEPLAKVASNTPVIVVDSPIDTRAAKAAGIDLRSYVGTDNAAAGRLAARALNRRLPPQAAVAVITGIPGDAGSEARARGFLREASGRLRVVAQVSADFNEGQARQATLEVLAAEPDLRGVFAVNDDMALGAARAVRDDDQVDVIGVDGTDRALRAVERGELTATVAQSPNLMGQLGVEACVDTVVGRQVPATIDAPIELITRANVERAMRESPEPPEGDPGPAAR